MKRCKKLQSLFDNGTLAWRHAGNERLYLLIQKQASGLECEIARIQPQSGSDQLVGYYSVEPEIHGSLAAIKEGIETAVARRRQLETASQT